MNIQPQLFTMIPAAASIVWAISVKLREKKVFDVITLSVCALALVINGLVVHEIIKYGVCAKWIHLLQLLLSSSIVPLAYMYFSRQMGRKWNNSTTVFCWSMVLIVLTPNLNIVIGDNTMIDPSLIGQFTVNIFKDGEVVTSLHTADLVIMIQALLTVGRMLPAAQTIRKYGLSISQKMKGFYLWWLAAVAFIAFTSIISTEDLRTSLGSWAYYTLYSLLICSIYSMLALRFDLHPVIIKNEGKAVQVDTFIDANKTMAAKLKIMLERDKIYLQHGYTAENAATDLGTNRTYFTRMMNAEFGRKFSDVINEYRVNNAKDLLSSSDLSIADIAEQCGFSDASYMDKKFTQAVGMTPGVYREQNKNL